MTNAEIREFRAEPRPALPMVLLLLALAAGSVWIFVDGCQTLAVPSVPGGGWSLALGIAGILLDLLLWFGFFIVNPNQAKALLLFGTYKGTVFKSGWWWANPFLLTKEVSLRARNLLGEKLKVNDLAGNPIEIAVVVVWHVKDTVKALFEVDDFVKYVGAQSEAAVRQLAGTYPYDAQLEHDEHDTTTISLRAGRDQVNAELERALAERLGRAGIEVVEARLSHLAYAPEIAGAMLQRQQANAVVAARSRIVDGAVGMVRMALEKLAKDQVVDLDPERRAAMVSNLLVVLCGHENAHPVVNAGTLYT